MCVLCVLCESVGAGVKAIVGTVQQDAAWRINSGRVVLATTMLSSIMVVWTLLALRWAVCCCVLLCVLCCG